MPSSSIAHQLRHAAPHVAYAFTGILAAAEIVILALALNPTVNADYRAYYIDRSTTCLNRDSVGDYTLGATVSFRNGGGKKATSMKVCGWSGPAGDGTHSLGETSRLRVRLPSHRGSLRITMEMSAVIRPPQTTQRVVFSVNGVEAHQVTLMGKPSRIVSFAIPSAVANSEVFDITFDYLDGIPPHRFASNTYKRAVRLLSFRIDTI